MFVNGINCVRTYTAPPLYLLDIAEKLGLKVMAGLPWEQHLTFYENRKAITRKVKDDVLSLQQHPAILCYTIGNEIPAPIVRWYGKNKIEKFENKAENAQIKIIIFFFILRLSLLHSRRN